MRLKTRTKREKMWMKRSFEYSRIRAWHIIYADLKVSIKFGRGVSDKLSPLDTNIEERLMTGGHPRIRSNHQSVSLHWTTKHSSSPELKQMRIVGLFPRLQVGTSKKPWQALKHKNQEASIPSLTRLPSTWLYRHTPPRSDVHLFIRSPRDPFFVFFYTKCPCSRLLWAVQMYANFDI